MLDLVISDEQRFYEILVRVLTQGIEFYGRGSMSPQGITFDGKGLVVLVTDGDGHVVSPAESGTADSATIDAPDPATDK